MLVIRRDQFLAFRNKAHHEFAVTLLPRIRHALASRVEALHDDALLAAIRRGIEHAERRGFVTKTAVFRFVSARFLLGDEFDRDPALPWARRVLDSAASPDDKLALLYAAMRARCGSRDV